MEEKIGGMVLHRRRGVEFLTFPALEVPFARHAFSTRAGGVSRGPFASMNLAFGRGDPDENVRENYRRFCAAAGLEASSLVSAAQNHHAFVRRVGPADRGAGIFEPQRMKSVDGLVTDSPGVTLVIHTADCVPVFLIDPERRAVGLAHAGWRGTAARIGAAAVAAMAREFGTRPGALLAGIGPSIGPCCFEVDRPVRDVFAGLTDLDPKGFIRDDGGGKYHIDLWEANRRILMRAGVPESSIAVAGICTRCHADRLFSHRASGGRRGGLAAFLGIGEGAQA
ncbi:MAG TPA: peptidoglycan editing factor PgeF [Ruminococcaceae bacterium]|jgi:hypothetical protein|nr:peptidoglycan editing factor PgeF [Oscillospiraceae bacterium]HBQ47219.1 peptidoglycan editing factor PgeF [Oscillospiraceae bacterium]